MDTITSNPTNPLISTSTPVFSDNVQDLLGTGTLQVNPTRIITVNSTNDAIDDPNSGVTTLRDAIVRANADAGEDLIVFDRSIFSTEKTITLNLGELDITHDVDIIAPLDTLTGGDLVTVSGNKSSRVFEVETGAQVNLSGLIVANGSVTGDNGGGIKNSGHLTLDNSIVRNNSATKSGDFIQPGSGGDGGGIFNTGNLTVHNSSLSGNSASTLFSYYDPSLSSTLGGPITEVFGSGGGIYSTGTIKVSNSTISANSTSLIGGGIYNSGQIDLSNSTISDNLVVNNAGGSVFVVGVIGTASGGGIYNTGTGTVSNSTISGNMTKAGAMTSGGGIYNTGSIVLTNSTLSSNSAIGATYENTGGGLYNSGTITISNSIFSGNMINRQNAIMVKNVIGVVVGGGIYNTGTSTINNSTRAR
ncbi:MAG: hypothetical protein DSM106950_44695 [Stigonema ocellatum SAG 48.90 = DSM 106950]|nr:hypothetical protein [Stigonema ocellatum SAG 48.90 = DSM 106950]